MKRISIIIAVTLLSITGIVIDKHSSQLHIVSAGTKALIITQHEQTTVFDAWCMERLNNGELRQNYIGRFSINGSSGAKFSFRDYNCEDLNINKDF